MKKTISIPRPMQDAIKEYAEENDLSHSNIIIIALDRFFREELEKKNATSNN